MKGGKGKVHDRPVAVCVMRVIPRVNYPIIVCLLGLGLAVLVRTVVIGQRAYDMLLPPTSGDDQAVAVAAVTSHTAEIAGTINVPAIAPGVVNTPLSEDQPRAALQQNLPIPRPSASEKQNAAPAQARRHHKVYLYRYFGSRFPPYWGPVVW